MVNIKHAISYTGGSKRCNLCLEEKLFILKENVKACLLNKRSELVSSCHHKRILRKYICMYIRKVSD